MGLATQRLEIRFEDLERCLSLSRFIIMDFGG